MPAGWTVELRTDGAGDGPLAPEAGALLAPV
jgi:hypothetical protein